MLQISADLRRCLSLKRALESQRANAAKDFKAGLKEQFCGLESAASLGDLTDGEVDAAIALEASKRAVTSWAAQMWDASSPHHPQIQSREDAGAHGIRLG